FLVYDIVTARPDAGDHTLQWNVHLTIAPDAASGPGLVVAPQSDSTWTVATSKAFADVHGIPGFVKTRSEIPWLKLYAPIAGGQTVTLAVLLLPFKTARPTARLDVASAGADRLICDVHRDGR